MRKIGIWIDHKKAVVTTIEDGRESQQVIEAEVERHAKPSGGWRTSTPWGPQAPVDEHAREGRYRRHLVEFYRQVIESIGRPDQLLVFGPGEAKREFVDEVEKSPALRGVPTKVETVDEMTDRQIAAKVRETAFE